MRVIGMSFTALCLVGHMYIVHTAAHCNLCRDTTKMDKFFSKELADAIGVWAALQVADLARQVRETIDRANAIFIAAGRPTLLEQWVKALDREKLPHGAPCGDSRKAGRSAMAEQRNGVYRGFDMSSYVSIDPSGDFRIVALWVRLTDRAGLANVPVVGAAAGRFADVEGAFAASFGCIQQAIDRHIDDLVSR